MTEFLKAAFAALVLSLAAGVGPAAAQLPSNVNPPAASVALAKEILALKQAGEIYKNAVPGLVAQAKNSFLERNLDKQQDLNEVAVKVAKDLAGRESEIGDAMAKLYANAFTEQELKDLVTFYKSPLGKKVIENEPRTIEQSMAFVNAWSQKFADEIVERFKAEMKKRGKEI